MEGQSDTFLSWAEERDHLLGAPPIKASGTDSEEDSEDDDLAAELESEMMGWLFKVNERITIQVESLY